MDKIFAKRAIKNNLQTAGGADTQIVILIVEIIGIHIELVIVRIPIRIDETSARPALALRYPCFRGNNTSFIRATPPTQNCCFFYLSLSRHKTLWLFATLSFLERFGRLAS